MDQSGIKTIFQNVIQLFNQAQVNYQSWDHEPILDFEADARVAKTLNWTAAPTKSLFLRLRDGRHAIFMTHRDQRMDSKKVKTLLGSRPSVCSDEEMIEVLGCVPGAVCPFGLPDSVSLVIDRELMNYQELMFTPGYPEKTFAYAAEALPRLEEYIAAPVYWLNS
ncbi:YbaK/EbsC family protein [Endozoicomonas sp. Mp262]|uniref:YbaK/EbsC family protein n=1 Tax=Endozoicomonas sp. Mp262 TaxID=2919499 RepID=UPI0021DB271D